MPVSFFLYLYVNFSPSYSASKISMHALASRNARARECTSARVIYHIYYVTALCNVRQLISWLRRSASRGHVFPPPLDLAAITVDTIVSIFAEKYRSAMKRAYRWKVKILTLLSWSFTRWIISLRRLITNTYNVNFVSKIDYAVREGRNHRVFKRWYPGYIREIAGTWNWVRCKVYTFTPRLRRY